MKSKKLFLLILSVFLGSHNFLTSQDIKVIKKSDYEYQITPEKKIILDKPFVKWYSGKISNKTIQGFLIYSLNDIENVSGYEYKFNFYKEGDSDFYQTYLKKDHDIFKGDISDEDGNKMYMIDYDPKNQSVFVTDNLLNTNGTLKENEVSFKAYDQLKYHQFRCSDNRLMADETYNFSFIPSKYPNSYKSVFAKLKDNKLNWEHSITGTNTITDSENDYCYSNINIETEIPIYLNKNIFVTEKFSYVFTGGAHGVYSSLYSVYDAEKGKKLEINDLIKNINDPKLLAIFKQKLKNKYNDMLFEDSLDELAVSDNFYIFPSGITFVYGIYSIAPYVVGEPSVFLSFDELKPFLKYNVFN